MCSNTGREDTQDDASSQIYGDKRAGFSNSSEYLVEMNFYPMNTRNHRLDVRWTDGDHVRDRVLGVF